MDLAGSNTVIQTCDSQENKPDQNQLQQVFKEKIILPFCGTPGTLYKKVMKKRLWLCRVCRKRIKMTDILLHNGTKAHKNLLEMHNELYKDVEFLPRYVRRGERSVAKIQESLDKITDKPLIGVEYIVEIMPPSPQQKPTYLCALCSNLRCDPISHVLSYRHKMKYMSVHFKQAHRHFGTCKVKFVQEEFKPILDKVAWAIEDYYGRLKARQFKSLEFLRIKKRRLGTGMHFNETEHLTFEDIVIEEMERARKEVTDSMRKNLEVSSEEEYQSSTETEEPEFENERTEYNPCTSGDVIEECKEKRTLDDNPVSVKKSPTFSQQNRGKNNPPIIIDDEKDDYANKLEVFRRLVKDIDDEMGKLLMKRKENPGDHPQYNDEWKKFWKRKCMDLQAKGKEILTYDFKPEWIEFWNERMLQLHNEETESKKIALCNTLGLFDGPPPPVPSWSALNKDREVIVDDDDDASHENPSKKRSRDNDWDSLNEYSDTSGYKGSEINMISVLRQMTIIEDKLGSLRPKVINLLSYASDMETEMVNSSEELLDIELNLVLLMTVAEKLRGKILTGLVDRVYENIFRFLIKDIEFVIQMTNQRKKRKEEESAKNLMVIPGVGYVLKDQMALQLICALVSQGRTNITQEELTQMMRVFE